MGGYKEGKDVLYPQLLMKVGRKAVMEAKEQFMAKKMMPPTYT